MTELDRSDAQNTPDEDAVDRVVRAARADIEEAFGVPVDEQVDLVVGANIRTLAEQAVRQSGRIRTLEAALAVERARNVKRISQAEANAAVTGELAIRRFLDDLTDAGLPSTVYQTFNSNYREFISRRLIFWADTANRLLGTLHAIPVEAIKARDAQYAESDIEHDGGFLLKAADIDHDDDTPDLDHLFGLSDEDDDE